MPAPLDWSSLTHAHGPATDLPALVATLAHPDPAVRERALVDLEARVAQHGLAYPASAPVLPLLVDHLALPDAPDRPAVAAVIGLVAWSHGPRPVDTAITTTLRALTPRLLPFLDDPDPELRLALVNTFGKLASLEPTAAAALAAHLATEPDPSITLSLAWAPHFGGSRARPWLAACEALLGSTDALRRIAGASALILSRREAAPEPAVALLLAALAAPDALIAAWKRMPWTQGIDVDLANLASFLGEKRLPRVLPAIAAAMERSDEAVAVAEAMLFMAFGDGAAPHHAKGLDAARREALTRLVGCDAAWSERTTEVLGFAGLPAARGELAAWVGVEVPASARDEGNGARRKEGKGVAGSVMAATIATRDEAPDGARHADPGAEAMVAEVVVPEPTAAAKKPVAGKKAPAKGKRASTKKRTA